MTTSGFWRVILVYQPLKINFAYGCWMGRIPRLYRESVLDEDSKKPLPVDSDPHCLFMLKHYRISNDSKDTCATPRSRFLWSGRDGYGRDISAPSGLSGGSSRPRRVQDPLSGYCIFCSRPQDYPSGFPRLWISGSHGPGSDPWDWNAARSTGTYFYHGSGRSSWWDVFPSYAGS